MILLLPSSTTTSRFLLLFSCIWLFQLPLSSREDLTSTFIASEQCIMHITEIVSIYFPYGSGSTMTKWWLCHISSVLYITDQPLLTNPMNSEYTIAFLSFYSSNNIRSLEYPADSIPTNNHKTSRSSELMVLRSSDPFQK